MKGLERKIEQYSHGKKTYRVVTRQYTYLVANIEANSQKEAEEIALESDALDWNWCDYGDSEIELVEEI